MDEPATGARAKILFGAICLYLLSLQPAFAQPAKQIQALQSAAPHPITTPSVFETAFWVEMGKRISEHALESMIQVGGILLVYFVVRTAINRVVDELTTRLAAREERLGITEERSGRLKTLSGLFKSSVGYVMFFVFGVLIFKAIGFDIMPFITTAGVIGLAIGFGAQKLVKDVISGFFIIVDNMFVVGDYITIGVMTGQVEEMGMRVTRLIDPNGRMIIISNGDIGTVTNLSRHPVEDFIEISVAPAFEISKAAAIIEETGDKMLTPENPSLRAAPRLVGVTAFSATSVTLRISVVAEPKTLVLEQMRVREVMRGALISAGIMPA